MKATLRYWTACVRALSADTLPLLNVLAICGGPSPVSAPAGGRLHVILRRFKHTLTF